MTIKVAPGWWRGDLFFAASAGNRIGMGNPDPRPDQILRGFLDRLHELSEWECNLSYHDGFAAGYALATAEFEAAIRFALGGPKTRSWRHAAERHHEAARAWRLRQAADLPGRRPGDHPGGPVDFETGVPAGEAA
jgi:hypothetical protein